VSAVPRIQMHLAIVASTVLLLTFVPAPVSAKTVETNPQSAAPSSISLSSDGYAIPAGESATLTARTDLADGSDTTLRIVDLTTDKTIQSCAADEICEASISPGAGLAHEYAAIAGDVKSNVVEISREAWTITLSTDAEVLDTSQRATLTATANQDVGDTDGEFEIFVFDATAGRLVTSCTTGTSCVFDDVAVSGGAGAALDFVALVGKTGDPTSPEDVVDPQASSTPVTISQEPWQVGIVTDVQQLVTGDTVHVTVTANQDLGGDEGEFAIHLYEDVSGTKIAYCESGSTCEADFFWDGASSAGTLVFVAYVATRGASVESDYLENVQTANGKVMGADRWDLALNADKSEAKAGEKVTLVASANQDVGLSRGAVSMYIVDVGNNDILRTCTTGTTCTFEAEMYRAGNTNRNSAIYQAFVAPSGALNREALQNSLASTAPLWVDSAPWTFDLDVTKIQRSSAVHCNDESGPLSDAWPSRCLSLELGYGRASRHLLQRFSLHLGRRDLLTGRLLRESEGAPAGTAHFAFGAVRRVYLWRRRRLLDNGERRTRTGPEP
jgi:hypothetical protein